MKVLRFMADQAGALVIITIVALALDYSLSKSVYFNPVYADGIALAITVVVTVGMVWALVRVKRPSV